MRAPAYGANRYSTVARKRVFLVTGRLHGAGRHWAYQQQHDGNEDRGENGPSVEDVYVSHERGLPGDHMADVAHGQAMGIGRRSHLRDSTKLAPMEPSS